MYPRCLDHQETYRTKEVRFKSFSHLRCYETLVLNLPNRQNLIYVHGKSSSSPHYRLSPRPLVQLSSTHCCASTRCLSSRWSTCGLTPKRMRDLILRRVSHLDAFSGYPCQTWLPNYAVGTTIGTPEVCPPRSSRTRGRFSQIPYAHIG